MDREDGRRGNGERDRVEVLDRIVGDRAVEARIDDQGRCNEDNRVAVGIGFGALAHADIAAGAADVLNEELPPEIFRKLLCDQAGEHIGRTAGPIGYDHPHRPRRIGLRPRDARHGRQRGSTRCQMQKSSAGTFHGVLSLKCYALRGPL